MAITILCQDIDILAEDTTDAVVSDDFEVKAGQPRTIHLYPEANLGTDVGNLQRKNPNGTYDDEYDKDGQIIMGATRPTETVTAEGVYRVEVPTRVAAWGICIDSPHR